MLVRPADLVSKDEYFTDTTPTALQALAESIQPAKHYRDASWPFRRIFGVNFLRASHEMSAIEAQRNFQATTGEAIRSVCEKRGLKLRSHVVTCDHGPSAMLHEIPLAQHPRERVFFYIHGGGYRKPLNPAAHMPVVLESAEALEAGRIFLLEYSLTPGLQYPGQLYQAASALNLLLANFDCQLGDMVLGGDSAGGNLVLALIAHIKQPHPLVPIISSLAGDDKLRGAVAISPWVSQTYNTKSVVENTPKDYLSPVSMTKFTEKWAPKEELWANSLKAPVDFWKELPVKRTLLTVGAFEILRDDVRELATRMGAKTDQESVVRYVESPAEIHVQSAVDSALGLPFCNSFLEILLWCRSLP